MVPVDFAKFWRIVFLHNTSDGCFRQSYHGTVMSAGVPVLWFCASTCFRFWSKSFTKRCSNNSLLPRDRAIYSLLDLIAFDFRICFRTTIEIYGKILIAFDEKFTQSLAQVNMKFHVSKDFLSPVLCSFSGAFNCRIWFGKRSMAVKIWILILFRFCWLCWLKNHLFCVLSLLLLQVVCIT